ncbi:MAG: hypothetical protein MZV65_32665 [Chromatiales bacterium]|nr:hypothetical protein [Chromatiales bacterium]
MLNRSGDLKSHIRLRFYRYGLKFLTVAEIVPKFVLCVRNPAAVVISRKNAFDSDVSLSELAWLNNIVSALYDSGGDVFILHYENWFTSPISVGLDLLRYTTLDAFSGQVEEVVADIVKNNLNLNSMINYEVKIILF